MYGSLEKVIQWVDNTLPVAAHCATFPRMMSSRAYEPFPQAVVGLAVFTLMGALGVEHSAKAKICPGF